MTAVVGLPMGFTFILAGFGVVALIHDAVGESVDSQACVDSVEECEGGVTPAALRVFAVVTEAMHLTNAFAAYVLWQSPGDVAARRLALFSVLSGAAWYAALFSLGLGDPSGLTEQFLLVSKYFVGPVALILAGCAW